MSNSLWSFFHSYSSVGTVVTNSEIVYRSALWKENFTSVESHPKPRAGAEGAWG